MKLKWEHLFFFFFNDSVSVTVGEINSKAQYPNEV